MENLDDRRSEFQSLEYQVKKSIQGHLRTIEELSDKFQKMVLNVRNLIRKDSDTNIKNVKNDSIEDVLLRNDIIYLEELFTKIRNATKSDNYNQIMPCLHAQVDLKVKLQNLVEGLSAKRDRILNKTNHAQLMQSFLVSSVSDNLEEYKRSKKELLANIAEENAKNAQYAQKRRMLGTLITSMRSSLQLLVQNCKALKDDEIKHHKSFGLQLPVAQANNVEFEKFIATEKSTPHMFEILTMKIQVLEKVAPTKLTDRQLDETDTNVLTLTSNRNTQTYLKSSDVEEVSLLEGLVVEELGVLTRADIKQMSAEIVKANEHNDDLIPMFEPKNNRHKFKPKTNK